MKDSNHNIKLNYLYRDAGNYKNFGSAVYANPNSYPIKLVEEKIRHFLIDREFFYAEKLYLPCLFFEQTLEQDPSWHEFENIAHSSEKPTDKRTIEDFLLALNDSGSSYE